MCVNTKFGFVNVDVTTLENDRDSPGKSKFQILELKTANSKSIVAYLTDI